MIVIGYTYSGYRFKTLNMYDEISGSGYINFKDKNRLILRNYLYGVAIL